MIVRKLGVGIAHFFIGYWFEIMVFQLENQIEEIIRPVIEDMGFELIRVKYITGKNPVLQIMAEKPDGTMTVENCSSLSREISATLDVEDQISGKYLLEVSSPGSDRPLTRLKDFESYKGFDAKVELKEFTEGQKKIKGVLGGIEDNSIIFQTNEEDWVIPFEDIKKAKLILTDDLINFSKNKEAVSD